MNGMKMKIRKIFIIKRQSLFLVIQKIKSVNADQSYLIKTVALKIFRRNPKKNFHPNDL